MTEKDFYRSSQEKREVSIDLLRLALMPLVITIHLMELVRPQDKGIWQFLVLIVCNSAVPALFIASGYFLDTRDKALIYCFWHPIKRLLPIHLVWLMFYYYAFAIMNHKTKLDFTYVVSGGFAYHLWFLPALTASLILVGVLLKLNRSWITWPILILITVIALSRGSYHHAFGLEGEGKRSGLLAAPLLVAIGAKFRRSQLLVHPSVILFILVLCYIIQIVENIFLAQLNGSPLIAYPFTVTTYALGLATFTLGRLVLDVTPPNLVRQSSRSTLGIYAVHLFIATLLAGFIVDRHIATIILLVFLTFVLSSGLSQLLSKVKWLRQFVI